MNNARSNGPFNRSTRSISNAARERDTAPCLASHNAYHRFVLYTTNEEDNQDEFRFELLPINAYVKDDLENLHVVLKSDNKDLLDNHKSLFHIDQIYSQHTDVLQRVVVIMKSNNKAYRASLKESLTNLFPDGVQDPEYFFFGYYMQPEHIHLQPLSKMVQDVVKQLKE